MTVSGRKTWLKTHFTLIVIAAVIFISFRLNNPGDDRVSSPAEPSFAAEVLSALEQKKAASVVVLAYNSPADIRNADKVIAALDSGKIKVLAYEIYNGNTSPARLAEVARAGGEPDVFYANGKLIAPAEIDAFIKSELGWRKNSDGKNNQRRPALPAAIEIRHLTKDYGNLRAVDDLSFTAAAGEIIALLGPNGAGKSTLMNMITGYLAPSSGDVFILGRNIRDNPLSAKASVGFLPEGAPLYPDLSVRDFLRYMAELRGLPAARIAEAAETANVTQVLRQKIETLSKGYLRRVGFAQSILSNPPILLLDEPTDGLDPNQKAHIRSLINQMGQEKTILISTHLLEEAETVCSRIILMNRGKIMADGSCAEIIARSGGKTLAEAFRKLTASEEEN